MATRLPFLVKHPRHREIGRHPIASAPEKGPRIRAEATRPAWILLYALLPLCAALFALVDYVPSSGGFRTLAEGVVVVLVIGLAAGWVRANRRTISQMPPDSEADSGPQDIRVEIHDPSPRVIRLEPRRNRSDG